jgi:hypothetical protein
MFLLPVCCGAFGRLVSYVLFHTDCFMIIFPRRLAQHCWIFLFLFAFPMLACAAQKKAPSKDEIAVEEYQEAAGYFLDACAKFGWDRIAIYAGISTVVSLFLLWPLSKLIAGGTFKKSCTYLFAATVAGAISIGLILWFVKEGWLMGVPIVALVILVAIIALAKSTYETTVLRAIGLVICYGIASSACSYATELVTGSMPWTEFAEKSPEEQKRLLIEWKEEKLVSEQQAAVLAAATAAPPTVQELYVKLQKARAELNANDPAAVARFNADVAAYNVAKAAAAPPVQAPAAASQKSKTAPNRGAAAESEKKSGASKRGA